jgi:hypothetical protein
MDSSDQRERLRRLHRAQLAAVRRRATAERIAALERARRRTTVSLAVVLLACVGLVTLGAVTEGNVIDAVFSSLRAKEARFDELTVGRAIRVVDETGRELAVLGREGAQPGGREPVVLGLNAHTRSGTAQTLRLAASPSGSALSLRTPDDRSSVALIAGAAGPEITLTEGSKRRTLSERPETPSALPPVAAPRGESRQALDLRQTGVQDIGHGFMVVRLAVEPSGAGARLRGRIINTSSVRHKRLEFRLLAAGRSESFRINLISPGNSTGFEVKLPGVAASDLQRGRIEYLGSTVNYFEHSLDGYDGAWVSNR